MVMKAARTSETLVNFYQTTRRYNLENSHLRTHRRENLKSYLPSSSLLDLADYKIFSSEVSPRLCVDMTL
jgi:hypothetical protein